MANINNTNFDWTRVTVDIVGLTTPLTLKTVQSIEYKYEVESEPLYGLGSSDPVAVAFGKRTYSGKIVLGFADVIALQKASTTGTSIAGLEDIKMFDITVTYKERDSSLIVVDKLNGVKLLANNRTVGNDKLNITMEIPLFISSISFSTVGSTL